MKVAGGEANIFTTLIRAEGLTRRWLPFGGKLLAGKLPARDRELLILRTAWNCRAEYEWAQHVVIGLSVGLNEEEISRIPAGIAGDPRPGGQQGEGGGNEGPGPKDGIDGGWTGIDALLLKAADELHETFRLSDSVWEDLAERYDEAQLIELPMLVGHYHMVAMALNALEVQLDPGLTGFPVEARPSNL